MAKLGRKAAGFSQRVKAIGEVFEKVDRPSLRQGGDLEGLKINEEGSSSNKRYDKPIRKWLWTLWLV